MTQKELLYVEDAIEHEKAIIKIINNSLTNLSQEYLSFMKEEQNTHQNILDNLISLLKETAHE